MTKMPKSPMNQGYRGYVIKPMIAGGFCVSFEQFHICYADSVEEAKYQIDAIQRPVVCLHTA